VRRRGEAGEVHGRLLSSERPAENCASDLEASKRDDSKQFWPIN